MNDEQTIAADLHELSHLAARVAATLSADIHRAGTLVAAALLSNHTVLACGNGGSAADAQHFVAELVGHMTLPRPPLPALALSTNPSIVTALSNDYGYEHVFARQVEAWGKPGDVLVAISTSGHSCNVLQAFRQARQRNMHTIALLGEGGLAEFDASDVCVHVPSANTQRVQEIHIAILHAICACVEQQQLAPQSTIPD
jgi:D-sedoheptulose 7-phosphate isomerase